MSFVASVLSTSEDFGLKWQILVPVQSFAVLNCCDQQECDIIVCLFWDNIKHLISIKHNCLFIQIVLSERWPFDGEAIVKTLNISIDSKQEK